MLGDDAEAEKKQLRAGDPTFGPWEVYTRHTILVQLPLGRTSRAKGSEMKHDSLTTTDCIFRCSSRTKSISKGRNERSLIIKGLAQNVVPRGTPSVIFRPR
jgi:hypothetical protein